MPNRDRVDCMCLFGLFFGGTSRIKVVKPQPERQVSCQIRRGFFIGFQAASFARIDFNVAPDTPRSPLYLCEARPFFGELGSLGQDKKRPDDEKLGPFHHHSEPEIQPHCLAARSRPQEGLSPERKNGKNRIQRPARQHVLSVLQPPVRHYRQMSLLAGDISLYKTFIPSRDLEPPVSFSLTGIIHIDVRMAGVGHPKAFCLDGPRAKRLNKTENSSSYLAQHPGIQNGLDLLAKKD